MIWLLKYLRNCSFKEIKKIKLDTKRKVLYNDFIVERSDLYENL